MLLTVREIRRGTAVSSWAAGVKLVDIPRLDIQGIEDFRQRVHTSIGLNGGSYLSGKRKESHCLAIKKKVDCLFMAFHSNRRDLSSLKQEVIVIA